MTSHGRAVGELCQSGGILVNEKMFPLYKKGHKLSQVHKKSIGISDTSPVFTWYQIDT